MLNKKRDRGQRPESAARPVLSIGAMAYADELNADYREFETGYRNTRYQFIGRALTSYRKFLKDAVGYAELLAQDNIKGLREKPDLNKTSRLVLYYITGARNKPERNAAGKLARVVDYLHRGGVGGDAAAAHIQDEGGIDEILKQARGREAPKVATQTVRDDVQDFDQEDERDEARSLPLTSSDMTDEIFDPEEDLSIRVGRETLDWVLGSEIGVGDSFYLECKKAGPADDWIRIVGKVVDLESA